MGAVTRSTGHGSAAVSLVVKANQPCHCRRLWDRYVLIWTLEIVCIRKVVTVDSSHKKRTIVDLTKIAILTIYLVQAAQEERAYTPKSVLMSPPEPRLCAVRVQSRPGKLFL